MPNYEHFIQSKITSNPQDYNGKINYRISEVYLTVDMETIRNHSIMKNLRQTDTELSKEYWRLKELKVQP